jgi:hypothetical protein
MVVLKQPKRGICGSAFKGSAVLWGELKSSSNNLDIDEDQGKGQSTRKRLTKEQKSAIKFHDEIKEQITGMILGDSHLDLPKTCKNARLMIGQMLLDKDFVFHLYEPFSDIGIVGAPAAYPAKAGGPLGQRLPWANG